MYMSQDYTALGKNGFKRAYNYPRGSKYPTFEALDTKVR